MAEVPKERRLKDLQYLREEIEREERAKSQLIPDGTEADFRDLLDFACTTPAKPVSPSKKSGDPAPKPSTPQS
jgi:hypothetical protein